MKFIADLHIHSKYSIATSKAMEPEQLYKWAQIKGIQVLGTGDFTHPGWLAELQEKLEPAEPGLFKLRGNLAEEIDKEVPDSCRGRVRFLLTSELSSIYKKNGRTRKVHNLMMAPDFETAGKIRKELGKLGNIDYDGRPIIGLDSQKVLEIALEANQDTLFVPAHIWTPHFSVLGKSGFDSLEECFEDLTRYIYAVETGLSSNPAMNWRLSQLDRVRLLSNSDSHSPEKIARNANLFDTEFSFGGIRDSLVNPDNAGFLGTLDFFPEEGKYHYDGHRKCGVRMSPEESEKKGNLCPVCGRKLILGVLNRVEELADRHNGEKPAQARPFEKLVPLKEIISQAVGVGAASKKVGLLYMELISELGNELKILREFCDTDLEKATLPLIAQGIKRIREGRVKVTPGYDGEYGTIQFL